MLRQFLIEDLEVDESMGPYAIQQTFRLIDEVASGELNNPDTVALIEKVARSYLSKRENIRRRVSEPVRRLCLAIIQFAESITNNTLPLQTKRLAILCALIIKDHQAVTRLQKQPCHEEAQAIRDITRNLLSPCHPTRGTGNPQHPLNEIFLDIVLLLQNPAKCIEILAELEERLADEYFKEGIDVSVYLNNPDHYIFFNHPWPSLEHVKQHPTTKGKLNEILLAKERLHGINLAPDSPVVFSGFVDDKVAKDCIKTGNLFVEYNLIGNMLHGKNIHRIQWYLILSAIEKGWIDTRGIPTQKIFSESSDTWLYSFDKYQAAETNSALTTNPYRFCAPHYCHSALLLLKDKLPCLSGTFRKAFARGIQTVASRQPQETSFAEICSVYDIRQLNIMPVFQEIPLQEYQQSKPRQNAINTVYGDTSRGNAGGAVFFKRRKIQARDTLNPHEDLVYYPNSTHPPLVCRK